MQKRYDTLIFDLDDTLIDDGESIRYAFDKVLKELNIPYSNKLFQEWRDADKDFWYKWANKKLALPQFRSIDEEVTYVRAYRFSLFFNTLKLSFDDTIDLNNLYCDNLGVNIVEIDGATSLIKDLSSNHEIAIASNGPLRAALNKIDKVNLDPYISSILTSGEIGIGKPNKEFFDCLYTRLENKDKSKMLLIGDSLSADIKGGMDNGIDTCWFNPNNEVLPKEYRPTMEINKLLQLKKKIK